MTPCMVSHGLVLVVAHCPLLGVPLSLRLLHQRLHRTKYPLQETVTILLTHRAIQPIALFVIPLTTGLMIVRIEDHHPVGQVTLI